jgi:hypothetical protein
MNTLFYSMLVITVLIAVSKQQTRVRIQAVKKTIVQDKPEVTPLLCLNMNQKLVDCSSSQIFILSCVKEGICALKNFLVSEYFLWDPPKDGNSDLILTAKIIETAEDFAKINEGWKPIKKVIQKKKTNSNQPYLFFYQIEAVSK